MNRSECTNIVKKVLEAPIRQLVENAGLEGSVVLDRMKRKPSYVGHNLLSLACFLITIEAVVSVNSERKRPQLPIYPVE